VAAEHDHILRKLQTCGPQRRQADPCDPIAPMQRLRLNAWPAILPVMGALIKIGRADEAELVEGTGG
jgi:hypothetical protein